MKQVLRTIIYVILVMVITLILCKIFIKPKVFSFKTTKEYEYIQNNKKDIDKVIVRHKTQLGESCYNLDIKKAYNILNNISIKNVAGGCYSDTKYLEFYFKNGTSKKIEFQCENLFYDGVSYELKDKIILFNKDEYMPDKITNGMIIVEDKDRIECK